ncbi:peptide/nickel transport system permease protein [Sulfitobacter marinus]|uniref:Peptide/nickel transport system permease protein n=1 Tax=Sulfitobacter marinus TaxID=394264 RepID=A0A1I6QIQ6_9RHOB|nr:ABC transporter permease [Sulfitobacter marinus]SFS52341.1 peptide/nickel transport system permease protein [Sulfitobacter marinus]
MEALTWTGSMAWLNPVLGVAVIVALCAYLLQIALSFIPNAEMRSVGSGSVSTADQGLSGLLGRIGAYGFLAALALLLVYVLAGVVMGPGAGIFGGLSRQLLPVWIALVMLFAVSITYKRRLGLYGKLFDSTVGMIGFGLVMFWVFAGVFGGVFDMLITHDSLSQVSGMKNKLPGTPLARAEPEDYQWFLLGGDNLARDVFSRLIKGSWVVVQIAPMATLFAFMVGITLGLPAGYYGGKLDVFLSFLANLILAFPVILLFYLLVTPEIVRTGIPNYMALVLFIFPLVFLAVLLNSRFYTQPSLRTPLLIVALGIAGWLYLSLVSTGGAIVDAPTYRMPGLPASLDLFDIDPGVLVVFVSVVFVNAPTVFRIVRGLALDIKTRDYVAAAQTRGEGPWYIMLWEILPNARGPLIVDFCLRIGYTTILLGTLGFFGLGLESESPDWGTTINAGRRLLALYPHAAIAPAVALLSLVLGLNLLADGLREESLRD